MHLQELLDFRQILRIRRPNRSRRNQPVTLAQDFTQIILNSRESFFVNSLGPTLSILLTGKPNELFTCGISYDSPPPHKSDITTQVNRQFLEQDSHLQGMLPFRLSAFIVITPPSTLSILMLCALQDIKTCHSGTGHLSSLQPDDGGALLPPGRALRGYCRRPA